MNDTEIIKLQTRCVSHEIRNHVSICDMYAEIIKRNIERDGYDNKSVLNAVDCIKKSLKIISNSLIDLKCLNKLTLQYYDFKNVVEEGFQLATPYIQDKNINMKCFVKNSAEIFIDETKFLACIVNIIKNAIEAIEIKGEISVIAEVKDGFGYIRISNNGKMISKEKQKEIFEEGFTTKQTGSGLGLYICKTNLEAQGARLKLNKSTRTVTEFEIAVPVVV